MKKKRLQCLNYLERMNNVETQRTWYGKTGQNKEEVKKSSGKRFKIKTV